MGMHGHLVCVLSSSTHLFIDLHLLTHAGSAHEESDMLLQPVGPESPGCPAQCWAFAKDGFGMVIYTHIQVMKENSVPRTPTHGHRGKEAPWGRAGGRLRPHSQN